MNNPTKRIVSIIIVLFQLLAWSIIANAQILYSGTAYTQNFQSLTGSTSSLNPVSNTTMLEVSQQAGGGNVSGWYIYGIGSTTRWGLTEGSSNSGGFYSMTDAGFNSRALGSQGSGSSFGYFGMVLKNTSGCVITSFTLNYNCWINRNPATTANSYPVSYLISATPIVGSGTGAGTFNDAAGSWITTTLGFTTPSTGTGAPGTQVAINPIFNFGNAGGTVSNIVWLPDTYLYIRWKETDEAQADATAGIDNVSFSTPTCTGPTASVLSGGGNMCAGGSSNLSVAITGGTPPYTVLLNSGNGLTTISNYQSGNPISVSPSSTTTYSLQCVLSSGGCVGQGNSGTATVTVNQVNAPSLNLFVSPGNTVCANANVTITATAQQAGSSPTYAFYKNGNLIQTGPSNQLNGNTFSNGDQISCTVTSSNPCSTVPTATATTQLTVLPAPVVFITASTTSVCQGGTISLSAGGANSYQWQPVNITGTNLSMYLAATTTFTVVGTNSQGCTGTTAVTVTVNPSPAVSAISNPIYCNGGSSDIQCTGSSGSSPYTYSLNGGTYQSSSLFNNVASGNYTVTIKDVNFCTATTYLQITQPQGMTIYNNAPPISCNGQTTNLTVSVLGGNPPYNYSLNGAPFQLSNEYLGLSAGTYTVTVLDINSCTVSSLLTINQPAVLTSTVSTGTILCYGALTTVTVNAFGGTAPYSGTGSFQVSAGTYNYIITDVNGCTTTANAIINQPPALIASATVTSAIPCSMMTGKVQVSAIGGTTPYTGIDEYIVGAGPYTFTVTDAYGCTATVSGTMNQPNVVVPIVSAGSIACNGGNSVVTVSGVGGNPPYTGTGTFSMAAGNYTINISDANGCAAAPYALSISQPTVVNASVSVTSPITCYGGNAQVTVNASGGTPYSTYPNYNGIGAQFFTAGYHAITVSDANGCTASTSITIPQPAPLSLSVSASSASSCSGQLISMNAAGSGTAYVWMPGLLYGTQQYAAPTASTVYTVTASDANGCSTTATLSINPTTNVNLALSSGGISTAGTVQQSQNHLDGFNLIYTDVQCKPIAKVSDASGGNVLGNTTCIALVENTIPSYNGQPYVKRHFTITPQSNGAATVTLFVTHNDFITYNAANGSWPDLPQTMSNTDPAIGLIRISKVDGALGSGPVTVITPTVSWNGNYWELTFPVSGFSSFYIHAANPFNSALPVSLRSFDVVRKGSCHVVSWETEQEYQNNFFTVYYSIDDMNYQALAQVSSSGSSPQTQRYAYTHLFPRLGHNYYKLSQTDIDGKEVFISEVKDVVVEGNDKEVILYPNPVSDQFHMLASFAGSVTCNLDIMDVTGRLLVREQFKATEGLNDFISNIALLNRGQYFVKLWTTKGILYEGKIYKQ